MNKRALCGLAAAAALIGGVVPAAAFACAGGTKGPTPKVTFCHHTSSATNPYVVITTANVALVRAHLKNHDGDALAVDGVCPTTDGGGGSGGPLL